MEDKLSPGSVNVLQVHTCQQCAARLLLRCALLVLLENILPLPIILQPAWTVLFVSLVHIWILHVLLIQTLAAILVSVDSILMLQELLFASIAARVQLANTG